MLISIATHAVGYLLFCILVACMEKVHENKFQMRKILQNYFSKNLSSEKAAENKYYDKYDNNKYDKCLNWDITRAKYTKELVDSIDGCTTKLYQLTLELQYAKSKKIY